jgi:hypothetical protein
VLSLPLVLIHDSKDLPTSEILKVLHESLIDELKGLAVFLLEMKTQGLESQGFCEDVICFKSYLHELDASLK